MRDLPLAADIVRQVRRRLTIPLTVKFRLGIDEASMCYRELGRICEAEGADAVTLHPRTARQMFRGAADWEHVARLKEAVSIPVIGNGDVRSAEDAVAKMSRSGCDGVMVGRGATRNPWIFRDIAARLAGGEAAAATLPARRALIRDHFATVIAREERAQALHKLRTFTGLYSHGLPDGQRLRRRISSLATPECFLAAVDEHFAGLLAEAA
jgi:tRNA-dihydrouridine synthase